MTAFASATSTTSTRLGRGNGAWLQSPANFAATSLGIFPPNTDSLGGTMTAGGAEYERVATTLVDPNNSNKPVTVVRSWLVGSASDAVPASTKAFNGDGSPYTGSLGALKAAGT